MKESIAVDAPLIDLDELPQWILRDDEDLLVVNKPARLVCHLSKNGPLSRPVGAVRMYTGADSCTWWLVWIGRRAAWWFLPASGGG